jgi:L-ascorbate metabolism protein UlaG (beta-lactamase superfamily)
MKIIKHAQSCLLVEAGKARILIDLGIFTAEQENLSAVDFPNIDILVITHEHQDHFDRDNVRLIMQNSNPIVLSTEAVIEELKGYYANGDYRITGDGTMHQFANLGVNIYGYESKHGPLPNGNPEPEVSGVVVDDGSQRFYIPGDTTIIKPEVADIDVAAIPICGKVVFDIPQAKRAVEALRPRIVIPYHYDNPKFPVNPQDFISAMADSAIKVNLLDNGETLVV